TKKYLHHLLDTEIVFGYIPSSDEAVELIKGIPSISLMLIISKMNLDLYLNDSGHKGQEMQNRLIKAHLPFRCLLQEKLLIAYKDAINNGAWPTVFYRYSNLCFYEIVLKNYNHEAPRELTPYEMHDFVKAYLIINTFVNHRTNITEEQLATSIAEGDIENLLLTKFIYQKDYASNSDFTNQVSRGYYFF